MLPTPWILFTWFRTYKWLFFLFTCHCVPDGRVALANRLTHRTRFIEDSLHRGSIEKQPPSHAFVPERPSSPLYHPSQHIPAGVSDYDDRPQMAISGGHNYRSIDRRYGEHHHGSSIDTAAADQQQPGDYFDRTPPTLRLFKQSAFKFDSPGDSVDSLPATCSAPDSRTGLCYEAVECSDRGGIPMGRCSGGGGAGSVCCLFEATCGDVVSEKHVYFHNPNYPRATETAQLCRLKVNKAVVGGGGGGGPKNAANICQLKLSFVEFDIAKPIEGNCTQDVFSVSGQNENNIIPRICGYNSGQHFYIAVDESGLVNLQMVLRGAYPRKFDIHLEQIECGSKDLAPPHCLQYYDSTQGQIKSFNYDARHHQSAEERESGGGAVFEGYPNNVDYMICIRKETGFCSVSYEFMADTSGTVLPFSVGMATGDAASRRSGGGGGGGYPASRIATERIAFGSAVQSNDCDDDYLIIGGLRVCSSRMVGSSTPTADENQNNQQEHVTLSSTTANSSPATIASSTEARNSNNDTRNGELHETMDENAAGGNGFGPTEVQQDSSPLRRPHRRADYHSGQQQQPSQHHYFFADRLGPPRTRSTKRNAPAAAAAGQLMATDWTPGPFQMRFVSNGINNARGFFLAYRQNPCRF